MARVTNLAADSSARLILEIDIGERLSVVIAFIAGEPRKSAAAEVVYIRAGIAALLRW